MYDVIILGGGPAGLTAGIYAARGGLKTAIVESLSVGGQASTASEIENYPGIEKTSGFELCYTMMNQCKAFGVEFIFEQISSIDLESANKSIFLTSGKTLSCKNIIIATGAKSRRLGLENEDKYIGGGISYCATCDGAFFKGKTVAVIGGGNTAVEDALYLEKIAGKVLLIHRRDSLRAEKIMSDRLLSSNVEPVWDSVVTKLAGDGKLSKIDVKNVKTAQLKSVCVDGVFVAIGQTPNTDMLDAVAKNAQGYIVTDENMRTNIDGVYAVGDVRQKALRQVVTAAADGAIAANHIVCSM